MIIYHHDDMDGYCSAAILLQKYPNAKTVSITYPEVPPVRSCCGQDVYIVDYSILPDQLETLKKVANKVVWIDHHKSAIEKYKDSRPEEIEGLRSTNYAGCLLTWLYINKDFKGHNVEILKDSVQDAPLAVQYVSDYDTWTHAMAPQCMYLLSVYNKVNPEPRSPWWTKMFTQPAAFNRSSHRR
jgi:uncharacterized protein